MKPRATARGFAQRVAPGYMADRARRYERELRRRIGVTMLAEELVDGRDAIVRGGPFAGIRYPPLRLADVDAAVTKLLGVYEREIAWVFSREIVRGTPTFIDIGCADGYYAAGMAYASPATTVHAFDLSRSARDLCAETAATSGVSERVLISRRFAIDRLRSIPSDRRLVLCDIEGGEAELLDRSMARALGSSVVVVEVHEDEVPGTGEELQRRFADTHDAVVVQQESREGLDLPELPAGWTAADRQRALSELRGPLLHWIVFEPRLEMGASSR